MSAKFFTRVLFNFFMRWLGGKRDFGSRVYIIKKKIQMRQSHWRATPQKSRGDFSRLIISISFTTGNIYKFLSFMFTPTFDGMVINYIMATRRQNRDAYVVWPRNVCSLKKRDSSEAVTPGKEAVGGHGPNFFSQVTNHGGGEGLSCFSRVKKNLELDVTQHTFVNIVNNSKF